MLEELSALVDKKTLLEIFHDVTKEKQSFLYINFMDTDLNKMFTVRFDKRILIE